jgi:hypothetical protein
MPRIACAFFCILVSFSANALTITPTFDASITNDVNAATIENTINSAIQLYQARFSDPITVTIQFKEISTSGLYGQSQWSYYTLSYSSFRSALASHATTANDTLAMSLLPASSINPVNGGGSIGVKTANMHALGFSGASGLTGGYDGIIGLHTSQLNLSRATTVATKGDLLSTVCHEMDEVLGMSSGLDFGTPLPLPQDLFRYSSTGSRTFTTSGDDAYFSIDGTNLLVRCNQNPSSGDMGDWWVAGAHTPRVQDAIATNGKTPNPNVELIALDVIGYTLVPLPNPVITNVVVSGSQLTISGTNGVAVNNYVVLASTNITTPRSQWIPLSTNFLNNTGPFTFVVPNAVTAANPVRFFSLQVQ